MVIELARESVRAAPRSVRPPQRAGRSPISGRSSHVIAAAAERDGLRRRPGGARRRAPARLPRHRSRLRPDVARAAGCTTSSPVTTRTSPSASGSAAPTAAIPTCGLDWITTPQPVVLERVAGRGRHGGDGFTSVAQLARAFRADRVRRPDATGCACTSSAGSPSCRARTGADVRAGARHRPGGRARPRRCCARTAGSSPTRARSRGDPDAYRRLRRSFAGRVHGREEHVRRARAAAGSATAASATSPAAGRCSRRTPVLASSIPTGDGLLAFTTLDEAVAGGRGDRGRLRAPRARGARARRGVLRLRPRCSRPALLGGTAVIDVERDDAYGSTGAAATTRGPGWINSDIKDGPGIDLSCDIRHGLPLADDSIDYAVSIHALPEIPYDDWCRRWRSCAACSSPGGVLRLALPDLDKGVARLPARGPRLLPRPGRGRRQASAASSSRRSSGTATRARSSPATSSRSCCRRPASAHRARVRFPADGQRVPRDRRARQPRAREPLRRGVPRRRTSLSPVRPREQAIQRRRGMGSPELGPGCRARGLRLLRRADRRGAVDRNALAGVSASSADSRSTAPAPRRRLRRGVRGSAEALAQALEAADTARQHQRQRPRPAVLSRRFRTAYLDIDPGYTQFWHASGLDRLPPHDVYFTIAENIGRQRCSLPTGGIEWRTTPAAGRPRRVAHFGGRRSAALYDRRDLAQPVRTPSVRRPDLWRQARRVPEGAAFAAPR